MSSTMPCQQRQCQVKRLQALGATHVHDKDEWARTGPRSWIPSATSSAYPTQTSDRAARGHTGQVRVNVLIAVVFVIAVVLERGDQDKEALFWILVGAGIVAVVGLATFLRSRGGIGATGD